MTLWNRAVRFFSGKEDATAQALIRICAGVLVILLFLQPLVEGVVPSIWMNIKDGGIFPLTKPPYLIRWLGGAHANTVYGLFGAGILSGLAILLGVWHRLFAFVALQSVIAITALNPYTPNGGDSLLTNMLWLLMFADASQTLSLNVKLKTKSWHAVAQISAWPRYLMIIQLCVLYMSAGFQKLSMHWVPFGDGQALWYIFNMPAYARFEPSILAWVSPLLQLASYFSWMFENIFPWLLLIVLRAENLPENKHGGPISRLLRRLQFRKVFILTGICLHIGIFLTMNVGLFSWMTLMYYPALFPSDWINVINGASPEKNSVTGNQVC